MSEIDGPEQEPDFDDPSYADLRGLLAGARDEAGTPADVVARLEATLSGLVAERADAEVEAGGAVVVPLRRSWAPRLLGAAAAVVLIGGVGYGLTQVSTTSSNDDKSAAGSSAVSGERGAPFAASVPPPSANSVEREPKGTTTASGPWAEAGQLGRLSTFTRAGFHRQVQAYVSATGLDDLALTGTSSDAGELAGSPELPTPGATGPSGTADAGGGGAMAPPNEGHAFSSKDLPRDLDSLRATSSCPGPSPTDGSTVLRIVFGNRPATLVLHPVVDGTRFVAAWSCDGSELLAATTLQP